MNKEQKLDNSTEAQIGYDTSLCGVITYDDLRKATDWIKAEIKLLETKQTKTQFEEGQLYELKILQQWIR